MFNPGKNIKNGKRGLLRIIFSRTMLTTLLLVLNFLYLLSIMLDLFQHVPIMFGSMVVFTAIVELVILNGNEPVDHKLSWAVLAAILPLPAAVLYLLVRQDIGNRLHRRSFNSSIAQSLPYIPEDPGVVSEIQTEEPRLAPIARYLSDHANAPAFTNTDVTYYPLGDLFWPDLLRELEQAEQFIFMEYFYIGYGQLWDSILEILKRKAAAGVEVRVLYDGMNAFFKLPHGYPKELEAMGIRCRVHAPMRPFVSTHYNYRDHRKITVIDGRTAFTGGINLEDRYVNIDSPYGHWKDTAVRLRGDAARGFTFLFLQMWNVTEWNPEYLPYLQRPVASAEASGYVIPFGDSPVGAKNVGRQVYLDMIYGARNYLYIMTPYLILDEATVNALIFAAKRGVDVRLILPGKTDNLLANILAKSHYGTMTAGGVKIYEYTPGFVHAKVFLSDDIHAVVGTINLDYRSLYHHFECAAYLYRVAALADIKTDFDSTLRQSRRIYQENVRQIPLLSRLLALLLKFFAPLM